MTTVCPTATLCVKNAYNIKYDYELQCQKLTEIFQIVTKKLLVRIRHLIV